MIWQFVDWVILIGLAACIAVWPTQLISDGQNRWLRVGVVGLCIIQVVADGPRMPLYPAYLVAALFAGLLVLNTKATDGPSSIRESKESSLKKLARWGVIAVTGLILLASVVLCLTYPRLD